MTDAQAALLSIITVSIISMPVVLFFVLLKVTEICSHLDSIRRMTLIAKIKAESKEEKKE